MSIGIMPSTEVSSTGKLRGIFFWQSPIRAFNQAPIPVLKMMDAA
jgi:hypothetical protein